MLGSFDKIDNQLSGNGFDVHTETDRLGMEIEQEIKPLVLALNHRGYSTSMSCGGHTLSERESDLSYRIKDGTGRLISRSDRELVYEFNDKYGRRIMDFNESPWVHIEVPEQGMDNFSSFLFERNLRNDIVWDLQEFIGGKTFRLETSPNYDLTKMQQDSVRLAYEILGSDKIS